MNKKRVYRLYREEGLVIRSKLPKRKRAWRYRSDRPTAGGPNEIWAMDFMADQLFDGQSFRILTIVDCHTREALAIAPRTNFRAFQVVDVLGQLIRSRGKPRSLRVVGAGLAQPDIATAEPVRASAHSGKGPENTKVG